MTNSLLIGKLIYAKLNQALHTDKIFPIVAENGTTYPYIVYKRTNLNSSVFSKDGLCEDTCDYSITIVSDKYDEGVELANEVRKTMEKPNLVSNDLAINNNRLISANEVWANDAYLQELNFNCKINN